MSSEYPEITTVTSKGQITIPSRLRRQFGLEQGTKLLVVPTEHGLVLNKVDLPSIEEFRERVEIREGTIELTMEQINELVHEGREDGG